MLYYRVGEFGESSFVVLGFDKCRIVVLESLAKVVLLG